MGIKLKKHLLYLKRERAGVYRRGFSYPYPYGLYLDRNERIAPFSASVLRLLNRKFLGSNFNLYPDVDRLYSKLSQWLGVDKKNIFITEGVSGAIKSLIEAIASKGDNIVFPVPTFALYQIYCRMFNLEYRNAGYKKDYTLDLDKMIQLIDKKTAIFFLPNPNIPIEGTLQLKTIASIANHCHKNKTFLAIDEVYFGFGGPTAINLINRFKNIFILRSFSKAFGLAGIRIGYIVGDKEKIDYISKVRTGYETNTLSMQVAEFFIEHYNLIEDYVRDIKKGLAYLKSEFEKIGLEYHGAEASNFVYVNLHNAELVKEVFGKLKDRNIYIRANWPYPYSGGFTVTGAPKLYMKQFIYELKKIL